MKQEQLAACLALWRAPAMNPEKFFSLIKAFSHLSDVFTLSTHDLGQCGLNENTIKAIKNPDWVGVEQDLSWAEKSNQFVITWQDETYPPLLREIPAAPPLLFVQGNPDILMKRQLAIVGSRNPSFAGAEIATQFAHHLASSGFVITSGLAVGIDTACHQGALQANGLTIGVMGTGFDRIYPPKNKKLAHDIVERGALVSDFPFGSDIKPYNFPRRNRIISGLSLGVLVVEAAVGSGSLITARHAIEQGREVFAIPGSIHNPLARGCHALIRDGAKLVETAEDIWEELGGLLQYKAPPPTQKKTKKPGNFVNPDYTELMEALGFAATPIDLLIKRTGLTAATISSMLSTLELQGCIIAVPGGYIKSQQKESNYV